MDFFVTVEVIVVVDVARGRGRDRLLFLVLVGFSVHSLDHPRRSLFNTPSKMTPDKKPPMCAHQATG